MLFILVASSARYGFAGGLAVRGAGVLVDGFASYLAVRHAGGSVRAPERFARQGPADE